MLDLSHLTTGRAVAALAGALGSLLALVALVRAVAELRDRGSDALGALWLAAQTRGGRRALLFLLAMQAILWGSLLADGA